MSDLNAVCQAFEPEVGTGSVAAGLPVATVAVALAAASSSTALATEPDTDGSTQVPTQYSIYNQGPNDAFVTFGVGAGVTAVLPSAGVLGGYPCPKGLVTVVTVNGKTPDHIAGICPAAGTAALFVTRGKGR